jgi:hypothetical protein
MQTYELTQFKSLSKFTILKRRYWPKGVRTTWRFKIFEVFSK